MTATMTERLEVVRRPAPRGREEALGDLERMWEAVRQAWHAANDHLAYQAIYTVLLGELERALGAAWHAARLVSEGTDGKHVVAQIDHVRRFHTAEYVLRMSAVNKALGSSWA